MFFEMFPAKYHSHLLLSALVMSAIVLSVSITVDTKGYIVYCPCMGRFGNQADQFLGALNFARLLDRTLVLPHWIEYPKTSPGRSIPFDDYFLVDPLLDYHRVILMADFMDRVAPLVWPAEERTVLCYQPRDARGNGEQNSCNAKQGNPFGPFWDHFNIDFPKSEFYQPLTFRNPDPSSWSARFPPDDWPVLVFAGAPASFPVTAENSLLHKYLVWSDNVSQQAQSIIDEHLPRPIVGVHLRIGSDWENTCRHVKPGKAHQLFASQQCLGSRFEFGYLTEEMCLPSSETVADQLIQAVSDYKAKSVFVARDNAKYDGVIRRAMEKLSISPYWLKADNPHVDLAILAKADHFIGSCVSTFSSFVTRERKAHSKTSAFWAFHQFGKDEL